MGRDGGGVVNSDFVLYVSAKTIGSCPTSEGARGSLAFASACQMESEYDRSVCVHVHMRALANIFVHDTGVTVYNSTHASNSNPHPSFTLSY